MGSAVSLFTVLLFTIVMGLVIGAVTLMVVFITEPVEYAKKFKEAIKILKGEVE